ncbi:MAG TPA: gliding motility-associated C-terminal domain-containing protein, partial [Crocinitomicaceae bacterium]|nr:gliding motility-associated C-terminal domain-containing protein [Crocinitomicaceae bacterium]
SSATNDDCLNALYICDINGYSASTSGSYTVDRPDNMRGNAEVLGTYAYTPGTNQGGIFGVNGNEPAYDVQIDNNSWIKFTAALATATLNVTISDCFTNAGIQMQIFEATNCTNFIPVSNFSESNSSFTITATGLTIGNDYYLMVDGFAGDICNYTISAESGVQFPEIVPVSPICIGSSVTLNAPIGATSYYWPHSGETTQSVTVTPATTQSYTAEVTGLCDYKQTLTTIVTVNPLPNVSITNGATAAICAGDNINLTATGASTYTWSNAQNGATINVSPSSLTNYTVTGIDNNGCSNTDVIAISVNSLPTLSATPTATDSDCGGSNGALTGSVASGNPNFNYSWSNGVSNVGNSANLSGIPAGSYTLTVTDGNTCSNTFGPFNVINPGAPAAPIVTIDDNTPCLNGTVNLSVTGDAGATFNWTGPNSFSSTNSTVSISPITQIEAGSYCVNQTVAGCTGPSACEIVTINSLPIVTITAANNDSTICLNEDIVLTASGATTYTWTGPNAFSGTNSTETITGATNLNAGTYSVTGTDNNGCTNTGIILIDILPLPSISITSNVGTTAYCIGSSATLTASGASTYSWSGPNAYSGTGNPVTILDLDANSQGYYLVDATDVEGCQNTDSILVNIVTNVPAYSSADTSLCPKSKLILYGNGGDSYFWSGPNGFSSTDQNPIISTSLSGSDEGWYVLTVIDSNGCAGFDSTYLDISHNADCLFIPNLVTPNFDNNNDNWVIEGLDEIPDAEVSIFNRWGNLIYYSSPYSNDWSGEVNKGTKIDGSNGKVPVGTYFYIINLNNGDETGIFKGYLEVEY